MATLPPQSTENDEGRLPWLDSGSVGGGPVGAGPVGAGRVPPPRPSPALRWIASLLILALVAVGAFLVGRRSELPPLPDTPPPLAPPPLAKRPPASAPSAPPPGAVVPVVPPPVEAQTAPALARVQAELPRPRTAESRPAPPPALHLRPAQVRAVRQIVRNSQVEAMRNTSPRVAARQAYGPRAGPSGRVVQLGAYRSLADAEAAASAFRYKYRGLLEPLPKAVLPIHYRNSRRIFYRVQFVTPSQAYSEVTCQRLRAAGKSCIVIY